MNAAVSAARPLEAAVGAVLKHYWGYDSLRPLQLEAIRAGVEHRDSLVVLPTGGGKSLCYQIPPLVAERTDVVVSPLISLMKDQIDALNQCGYPAAALHSGQNDAERREVAAGIEAKRYRLIFASPERLLSDWFMGMATRQEVSAFHIDEAHCISQWGHDFRPEYRRLATLKQRFPNASIHAYTATATPRVRKDIVDQLGLHNASVLVGNFDRPNLVYRIVPRVDADSQILEIAKRHNGEAMIVYCISRKDTEEAAAALKARGIRAASYHAGMTTEQRTRTQEAFASEKLDVVVATVAFGMGIDRSNVRCVVHAAMPKSVEHFQQETGRAGRDGLEAECVLLYSGRDYMRWDFVMTKSAEETGQPEETLAAQRGLLDDMRRLATSSTCRHSALSRYFGQEYPAPNCSACDVCLNEVEGIDGADEIARQILACVSDLRQRFGVGQIVDVLVGARTERITQFGHNQLPSYGALAKIERKTVQSLVFQLVDHGLLERTEGDRPVLKLTQRSAAVLGGGGQPVRLVKPGAAQSTEVEKSQWKDVDRGLFEALREMRKRIADQRRVPAFVVLSDTVLREVARIRPGNEAALKRAKGIGDLKLADLGPQLLHVVLCYCKEHGLSLMEGTGQPSLGAVPKPNAGKDLAYKLFAAGRDLASVAAAIGRAPATTCSYLEEYIREKRPAGVAQWVDDQTYATVVRAAREVGGERLKPIFEHLDGSIPYEQLRVVLAHMETTT